MTFLDKTFCASPNCKNECGRKMTDEKREFLKQLALKCTKSINVVSYGYFCDKPEDKD